MPRLVALLLSRRWVRPAMLVACLIVGLAAAPDQSPMSGQPAGAAPPASSFSPEQRAEIVRILRDALKDDPSILRDAANALQADDENRQTEATRAAIASQRAALDANPSDPSAGNPKGDVTIVEFFDTRCPYCRHMDPTMAQFMASDPNVRLVYKDLPILGPASVLGSRALLAAQRQGGYEKLRSAIMSDPPDATMDTIKAEAESVGLDWAQLQKDMNDPSIQQRLDANTQLAKTLGIQGTPALVIGDTLIPGAIDQTELQKAVANARQ
jgi:protein-disulfide isomerase